MYRVCVIMGMSAWEHVPCLCDYVYVCVRTCTVFVWLCVCLRENMYLVLVIVRALPCLCDYVHVCVRTCTVSVWWCVCLRENMYRVCVMMCVYVRTCTVSMWWCVCLCENMYRVYVMMCMSTWEHVPCLCDGVYVYMRTCTVSVWWCVCLHENMYRGHVCAHTCWSLVNVHGEREMASLIGDVCLSVVARRPQGAKQARHQMHQASCFSVKQPRNKWGTSASWQPRVSIGGHE